jgi:hypothetical protein
MFGISIEKWSPQSKEFAKIGVMIVVAWGTLLSMLAITVLTLDYLRLR